MPGKGNLLIPLAKLLLAVPVAMAHSAAADQTSTAVVAAKAEENPPIKAGTSASSTMTLPARLSGRSASAAQDDSAVRLAVRGVSVQGNPDVVGFKVFLNKQDASHDTPSSDPHYVGAFAFGELSSAHTESVNLDATRAFHHLKVMADGTLHKHFTATLVPILESPTATNSKVVILASDAELQIVPATRAAK